ncbi:MAG: glycoside hydrolase family 3 protein [Treponema sp.]|jgi:beta-N-acetylhexosaminidase|nr:glycoside hydrolase family 3 protein [Treponema sp.]
MRLIFVFTILLLLFACSGKKDNTPEPTDEPTETETAATIGPNTDIIARERAALIASSLDDRQLCAQVIFTGIDGKGNLTRDMKILLSECPAGGIVLFRYNLNTDNSAIQKLIAESIALIAEGNTVELPADDEVYVTIPPFVVVDHEGGKVNRFLPGAADLPDAYSYWEEAQSEGRGSAILHILTDSFNAGKKLRELGINFNLAPVAEFLNEDNSEFLEGRSYGPDPAFTVNSARAFIMGMDLAGVTCAVKHFPGSAGADPHYFPGKLNGDKTALEELVFPFAALIKNNQTRAIMVSHSAVPAWDSENIASLSPAVMGEWLRQEFGFEGLIISDDFSMGAATGSGRTKPEDAAVQSLIAGADIVLVWPPDLRRTHRAIQAALADGRLSRQRLEESAERIIFLKLTGNR